MPLKLEKIKNFFVLNIGTFFSAFALTSIILLNNLALKIELGTIIYLLLGSACIHLLTLLSFNEMKKTKSIIKDSFIIFLTILAAHIFFHNDNIIIKIVFIILIFLGYRLIIFFLDIKETGNISVSFAATVAILFLIFRLNIPISEIHWIIGGIFRNFSSMYVLQIVMLILVILCYYLFFLFHHELILFSLGKEYFEIANYSYRSTNLLMEIIKTIFLIMAIFCAGIFAPIASRLIFLPKRSRLVDHINSMLQVALFMQIFICFEKLVGTTITLVIAIILSVLHPHIIQRSIHK